MNRGDSCDIVEILSTAERDFLVRNNRDQVKIDSLRGKTICIYFAFLLEEIENAEASISFAEVYNELSPKGEFEVVFVAAIDGGGSPKMKKSKIDDVVLFNNLFSKMPWLSIPYSDVETRTRLCNLFSMTPSIGSDCVILNPNGMVVQPYGRDILNSFGAEAYPFTDERINEIIKEDQVDMNNLCFKTLLGSSTLVRNDMKKVPISELEGKVVGLYMYDGEREIMQKLLQVYKELKQREEKFEIVLINLHFWGGYSDENSFEQKFKKMPWLALPFMDKRCRKVWRILGRPGVDYTDDGILVIILPDGNSIEIYSSTIVEKYGIAAYPFTKQKAVELEMTRVKEVTLQRLFEESEQKFVIQRNGAEIPVSDLKGKSILLYSPDTDTHELVPKLKEWYDEIKGKDETFEVIYVSQCSCQSTFENLFSDMPWLASPYDKGKVLRSVFGDLLGYTSAELVAFGSDGHIVTKEASQRLQDEGVNAYPFTEDKLAEEILVELTFTNCWHCTLGIADGDGNRYQT